MPQRANKSALKLISGRTLEAVCFVVDYITFQFGDLVLAALALPVVTEDSSVLTADQLGYRDALCRQIGRTVVSTSENAYRLEIDLDRGTRIVISLDAAHPPGPEMATLSGGGHFTAWLRPGTQPGRETDET